MKVVIGRLTLTWGFLAQFIANYCMSSTELSSAEVWEIPRCGPVRGDSVSRSL